MNNLVNLPGYFELLSWLENDPDKSIGYRTTDPLLDSSDINTVSRAVKCMRDFPYSLFGFECTLQPGVKKVDFAFSLTREMAEKVIAQGRPLPEWFGSNTSPGLERVKSFLMQWLDNRSLLYHSIYSVYLELDASSERDAGIPGMFARLQSGNRRKEWYETMSLAVLHSAGIELTRTRREMIKHYYECFTDVAEFFHLGIMFSRDNCPFKLASMYISAEDTVRILNMLGIDIFECVNEDEWGSIVRFTSGKLGLSLDFTDKLQKRIGIEIEHSDKDEMILDWLVEKGCCSIEKRNAVLNWSGVFSHSFPDDSGREIRIKRSISHFKLVLQPNMPIMAKVYFDYDC